MATPRPSLDVALLAGLDAEDRRTLAEGLLRGAAYLREIGCEELADQNEIDALSVYPRLVN